jgi:hypothetical protein
MYRRYSHFGKKTGSVFIIIELMMLLAVLVSPESVHIARAQSPITARVDRTRLAIDEQVTLTVTVTGDFLNIPNPDLSSLQDFVVVSSSTSTQVSIVNGQMSSQKIFIYRLQPLNVGALIIGSLSLNVGGKIHQTDPIGVEVLASGTQIAPPIGGEPDTNVPNTLSGQNFFVEAEVDNPTPYLGEQIIYTFRLYQAVQFPPGQPDYHAPTFTDFWSDEILVQPHYNTEAGGRRYVVSEILTALFPANLGQITIEPARLVIPNGLLNPDVGLETNAVTVTVRPLPKNAPKTFNGAIGQFEIRASLSETEVKINEPVTLLVEIEGAGNIRTLTEPALSELPDWRLFDSEISTTVDTNEGRLRGIRSFERLVVPGRSGQQSFSPINFSYFDPQAETYKTISTDPIPIMVLADESTPVPFIAAEIDPERGSRSIERIATDIRHIKSVPPTLGPMLDTSSIGWGLYWTGWILPALIMGGVQIWQSRQQRLRQDTAYARDLQARRTALKILADVQHSDTGRPAAAAGRALLGYLSDKFNTPTVGLTINNLITLLRQAQLEEDSIERIEVLLHQIDVDRFAPLVEGAAHLIIADTQRLINDLEKSFGRRR